MWSPRCCEGDLSLFDLLDLSGGADIAPGYFFMNMIWRTIKSVLDLRSSVVNWKTIWREIESYLEITLEELIESSATSKIWKSRGRPAVPDHITVSFFLNHHFDTKAIVKAGMEIDKPP